MSDKESSNTPEPNNFGKSLNHNSNNNFHNLNYNPGNYEKYLVNNNRFENQNNFNRIETPIQKRYKKIINTKNLNDNTKTKINQNQINVEHYKNSKKSKIIHNDYVHNYSTKSSIINIKNIYSQRNVVYQNIDKSKQNELLLNLFIYTYYYEKALSEKNIFINNNEKYYLIK